MFKSRPRKYEIFCNMFNNLKDPSRSTLGHYCTILSLTLCEQTPLDELLAQLDIDQNSSEAHNQMNLFD